MTILVQVELNYKLDGPVDIMLKLEAAELPEQSVVHWEIDVGQCEHLARVPADDMIGECVWLRTSGDMQVKYSAEVQINRILTDYRTLPQVPVHQLPGPTVSYLNEFRYCPSNQFMNFVKTKFAQYEGGQKVGALCDWVFENIEYVRGSSDANTTAQDTFTDRRGVCRDFAHLLITLVRAAAIPARTASVYAPGVEPQDFHAVAEVFLGGEWHLVDPTGMAMESEMVKICIGRDAADIAFLTAYGPIERVSQFVSVYRSNDIPAFNPLPRELLPVS